MYWDRQAWGNSVDPDQMQHNVATDQSLHCLPLIQMGWKGVAKVSCILHHWGIQLILAYTWARPAILIAGKGRWGMILFLLFLHFHSCSLSFLSLSFISSTISFLPFSERRHKMTHKGWRIVKPQHNQSLPLIQHYFRHINRYHIRTNYHTCSYKRTVKQFSSF